MKIDINKINPYIRVAFNYSVLPRGNTIKRRVIFDYELLYVEKGEFTLVYNNKDYKCKKGDFLLIRPDIPHEFKSIKADLSQPHIHFDFFYTDKSRLVPISFKDSSDFSESEKLLVSEDIFKDYPPTPFITFKDSETIIKNIYKIAESYKDNKLSARACMLNIIEKIIADNFPDSIASNTNSYNIARQIKDYIDAGQGLNADLSVLENIFSYSKYHLEREFKKEYGISLIAYRNKIKMETANSLLKYKSIGEVSEQLNYTSIYVFSRAFKNYYKVSPSEYKKSLLL